MNKTKNIYLDILQEEFELPKDNQKIVKVIYKNPNHIFDVLGEDEIVFKAILNSRFQKTVWVKVNKLVIVEDVGGNFPEIVKVPTDNYIKFLRKNNAIPSIFEEKLENDGEDLFCINPNQRTIVYSSSDSSSEEDN
ncbi:probable RNA-binding protein EIF1AD [Onthophagus taurus]|uniref:probable RNA-binding protein EIF1AD n=1 Tax=Onthophagus taurus TaxID=166361 RepID=UPI0039BE0001